MTRVETQHGSLGGELSGEVHHSELSGGKVHHSETVQNCSEMKYG